MDSNVGGHLGTFPNWHCWVVCPPGCRQTLHLEVACHDGPLQTHECWWRWRLCNRVSFAAVVRGAWAWRSNGPPNNPLRSPASTHKTLLNDEQTVPCCVCACSSFHGWFNAWRSDRFKLGGHLGTFPNWQRRVVCPPGCRQTLHFEVACHDGPLQTHECWWRRFDRNDVSFAAVVRGAWAW